MHLLISKGLHGVMAGSLEYVLIPSFISVALKKRARYHPRLPVAIYLHAKHLWCKKTRLSKVESYLKVNT